jgi:hypothetical protein
MAILATIGNHADAELEFGTRGCLGFHGFEVFGVSSLHPADLDPGKE